MNRDHLALRNETWKRFDRFCNDCGDKFTPTGKFNRICTKCQYKNMMDSRKKVKDKKEKSGYILVKGKKPKRCIDCGNILGRGARTNSKRCSKCSNKNYGKKHYYNRKRKKMQILPLP